MRSKVLLPTVIGIFFGIISPIFSRSPIATIDHWNPDNEPTWKSILDGAVVTTGSVWVGDQYVSYVPDAVDAVVECSVTPTGDSWYRYGYRVSNVASQSIAAIGVDVAAVVRNASPRDGHLVSGKWVWNYAKSDGSRSQSHKIYWKGKQGGYTSSEYGLAPSQSVELVLESPSPPSLSRMWIRGTGWVIDAAGNRIVSAPSDLWKTGYVFGPDQSLSTMDARTVVDGLVADVQIASSNGWITGNATLSLLDSLSAFRESLGTTRNESVIAETLTTIRSGLGPISSGTYSREWVDSSFLQYLFVKIQYYYDRFGRTGEVTQ
ncbi:hypothetical protein EBR57_07345 [bacterium]|nr:hypothetical protein [bacterium]